MATISLCMIVRDEEDVIGRCLESMKDLADEIIIVDTGSVDKTKEIVKEYTDQVYEFTWINDFAAARNFSFSKANMDFVMWMDADDILKEADRNAFMELKAKLNPEIDMVMMSYHVAFDSQGNPTMTYYRERLMRREKDYRWTGAVHEVIVPEGNIIYSQAAVTHSKLHPSDPDRNLSIYEGLLERGVRLDPRHQFYYARELFYHSRYQEASEVFTAFLNGQEGWVENNISACLDLSECYRRTGRQQEALQALFRSFAYDKPRPEVCCAIGNSFLEAQSCPIAAYWYEQAAKAEVNPQNGGFQSPDSRDFLPYLQLCVCHDRMGNQTLAKEYHNKAKALKPDDPAVLYNEEYFSSL